MLFFKDKIRCPGALQHQRVEKISNNNWVRVARSILSKLLGSQVKCKRVRWGKIRQLGGFGRF